MLPIAERCSARARRAFCISGGERKGGEAAAPQEMPVRPIRRERIGTAASRLAPERVARRGEAQDEPSNPSCFRSRSDAVLAHAGLNLGGIRSCPISRRCVASNARRRVAKIACAGLLQKKVDAHHRDQNNRALSGAGSGGLRSAILGDRRAAAESVSTRP